MCAGHRAGGDGGLSGLAGGWATEVLGGGEALGFADQIQERHGQQQSQNGLYGSGTYCGKRGHFFDFRLAMLGILGTRSLIGQTESLVPRRESGSQGASCDVRLRGRTS